jgi:hypothetical protein
MTALRFLTLLALLLPASAGAQTWSCAPGADCRPWFRAGIDQVCEWHEGTTDPICEPYKPITLDDARKICERHTIMESPGLHADIDLYYNPVFSDLCKKAVGSAASAMDQADLSVLKAFVDALPKETK